MHPSLSRPRGLHILVVDDDPQVSLALARYLGAHDLQVSAADSGRAMRQMLRAQAYDLMVLDVRLPDADGAALVREVRQASAIPIIMLTGRHDEADRVMCLELGADDYLTKPFSPRELLARIRARLRRATMQTPLPDALADITAFRFDGWSLDVKARELVSPDGRHVQPRRVELNLLIAFLSAPDRTLSRGELLDLSRLDASEVYERAVDVHIGRLRKLIEPDPGSPRYIVTERGAGYAFRAPVEVSRG